MDGLSLDTSQSKIWDYSGSICLQCCNDSLGIKVSGRVRGVHELCDGLWYCFKELVSIFLCPDMPDLLLFGHSIEWITNWRRVHSALINLQKIDCPPHHKGFLLPDWLTCVGIPGTQISNYSEATNSCLRDTCMIATVNSKIRSLKTKFTASLSMFSILLLLLQDKEESKFTWSNISHCVERKVSLHLLSSKTQKCG